MGSDPGLVACDVRLYCYDVRVACKGLLPAPKPPRPKFPQPKPPRQKTIRQRVIRWCTNAIDDKLWRDHIARVFNTAHGDLSIDLPDLAGWYVGFKRLDTAKNVTVSNLCILRRTITPCDAQTQPGHLGLGFILDDRTDVVVVIADPSQRRIADLDLRSRFGGPWFLLEYAAGSLLSRGYPLVFVLGLLLFFLLCGIFASSIARPEITCEQRG